MARHSQRLTFRSVDAQPTPAGRIIDAAHISHGNGTGPSPRRFPSFAAALLVRGGGLYADQRGFSTPLVPGDLILVNPRIEHTYGPGAGEDWEEWYVAFEGPVFDALENCGVLDIHRPIWRLGEPRSWLTRFQALFPPAGHPVEASEQVGGLLAWLISASAHKSALYEGGTNREEIWLSRAKHRLVTPDPEAGNLEAVARECGLGYESFRKRFAQLTGESPAKFRRRQLILRAQGLMAERDLPDRAIAASLGFCDEFHFSKTFKKVAGVSPRQWRSGLGRERA
jgi:AraC-like DNA-binding protein